MSYINGVFFEFACNAKNFLIAVLQFFSTLSPFRQCFWTDQQNSFNFFFYRLLRNSRVSITKIILMDTMENFYVENVQIIWIFV